MYGLSREGLVLDGRPIVTRLARFARRIHVTGRITCDVRMSRGFITGANPMCVGIRRRVPQVAAPWGAVDVCVQRIRAKCFPLA